MADSLGTWLNLLVDRHIEKDPAKVETMLSWAEHATDSQCDSNGWYYLLGLELARRVDASAHGSKSKTIGAWIEDAGRSKSFWYERMKGARQISKLMEEEDFSTAVERRAFDRSWKKIPGAIEAMLEGRDPDAVQEPPPKPAPKTAKEVVDEARDLMLALASTTPELAYLAEQLGVVQQAVRERMAAEAEAGAEPEAVRRPEVEVTRPVASEEAVSAVEGEATRRREPGEGVVRLVEEAEAATGPVEVDAEAPEEEARVRSSELGGRPEESSVPREARTGRDARVEVGGSREGRRGGRGGRRAREPDEPRLSMARPNDHSL